MSFRFACADFTFPLLTHDQALTLIGMLGFEGVDIGLFEGRSHLVPSKHLFDPRSAALLKAKTSDLGLQVADVFLQVDTDFSLFAINHPSSASREKARQWFLYTLEYARTSGSPHVTILPGVFFNGEAEEASFGRCEEELAWRVEKAEAIDVKFSVEAHLGSIIPTPKAALSLIRRVPGLSLTLDYTHFTSVGIPDSEVEPLVEYATHFHARGARYERLQAPVKDNKIDYSRVIRVLGDYNYAGYLGIEYVWIDWEHCNEVDNLSETILLRNLLQSCRPT
jgi:sugar phosphate isomerase/epimerase